MSANMDDQAILAFFKSLVGPHSDLSAGVAAMKTLAKVLSRDRAETLQELVENLQKATETIKSADASVTSVSSGCELFLRFITLASDSLEQENFQECKKVMLKRGDIFLKKLEGAREKIARLGAPFVQDGAHILTHSMSRVILHTLKEAHKQNNRFEVYITVSAPDNSGKKMYDKLRDEGISCHLVLDGAVGHLMERMDCVMVGAEGVVESGGIINKIGSLTLALCARAMHKPLYVLAESFKFVRLYPLDQGDLPQNFKYPASKIRKGDLEEAHPLVDYTPPSYITLLITDLGILTPSAVSDELIKLYL